MPTLSELAKKAAQRKIDKAEAAQKAHDIQVLAAKRERQLQGQIERSIAWMMGTTIRDLHKAGKLTPEQCAVVSEILQLLPAEERPANWDLLAPYLPPPRPEIVPDPAPEAEAA